MRWIYFFLFFISFFSCSAPSMPVININHDNVFNNESKLSCYITIKQDESVIETKATAKYRGGFSSGFSKKSYTVELDSQYNFGDIIEDDDWIFNANYIDKTFMRHKISYDIFREMGINNKSAKSFYASLYDNNEYQGLYLVQEKVNAGMLELDKKDSLAMLFKDPPVFKKTFSPSLEKKNPYGQKFPKWKKERKNDFIESFSAFLNETPDSTFTQQIDSWIDIKNIIDWHLLLELTNNSDGILKNFYLYKKDSKTPCRICIWDYDHSFGRDGDNELNMLDNILDCNRSILFDRLLHNNQSPYPLLLEERYKELRNSGLFSVRNIEDHWERNYQFIKGELKTNFKKWPVDGEYYYDANNFSKEKALFFKFLNQRIIQLDKRFGYN